MRTLARILLPIAVLALGILGAQGLAGLREVPEPVDPLIEPPIVEVQVVELGSERLVVESQGRAVPAIESDLVSEVSGRITFVSPRLVVGGFFDEGELLARIDPQNFEIQVTQAEGELARAELKLAEEKALAEVAKAEWEGMRSGEEVSDLTLRVPHVAQAEAEVASAEARLAKARLDLARTEIRAPFTGRVREKSVDLGNYAMIGQRLARIYSIDALEVRLPVPDADMAFLDFELGYRAADTVVEGPDVTLWTEFGGGDVTWDARLVRTEGEIDPRTHMVVLVARVDDPYGMRDDTGHPPLALGLFLEARIEGSVAHDVARIPRGAIHGAGTVWVERDGTIASRTVEILRHDGLETIVAGGLSNGDSLIVSHLDAFVEGMRVRVAEPTQDAR